MTNGCSALEPHQHFHLVLLNNVDGILLHQIRVIMIFRHHHRYHHRFSWYRPYLRARTFWMQTSNGQRDWCCLPLRVTTTMRRHQSHTFI
mmetsp:Transcript_7572/g.19597  ORF Transcript_7572/g.19597 Transcript_7572/m.19597 type:complete len:90 (+) Transcript_7572:34-303(+)